MEKNGLVLESDLESTIKEIDPMINSTTIPLFEGNRYSTEIVSTLARVLTIFPRAKPCPIDEKAALARYNTLSIRIPFLPGIV